MGWWPILDDVRVLLTLFLRVIWIFTKEKVILPALLFAMNVFGLLVCFIAFPIFVYLTKQKQATINFEIALIVTSLCVVAHFVLSLPILLLIVAPKEINHEMEANEMGRGERVNGPRFGNWFGARGRGQIRPTDVEQQRRTQAEDMRRRQAEEEKRQLDAERRRELFARQNDPLAENRDGGEEMENLNNSYNTDPPASIPIVVSPAKVPERGDGQKMEVRIRLPDGSTVDLEMGTEQKVSELYAKAKETLINKKFSKSCKLIEAAKRRVVENGGQSIGKEFSSVVKVGKVLLLVN